MTDTATTPAADPQKTRGVMLLFGGLMLTMLLASLNQTVLSTALPTIVGELHGVEEMLWVITAFILASTIMMPIYGKVSDTVGRKPVLLAAISIFLAGSIVGALAPTMTWLIVARVIQGLGGGGLIILSQATIADVIPARERGKYMGIMGGVFAVSSVAGPLLGGWFTEGPGWRWVFWINLPIGALAMIAAIAFLKLPPVHRDKKSRVDTLGMMVLAVTTTAIVLVGTWGGSQYAWTSPMILGLIAASVVGVIALVAVERRAQSPVLPMGLFADRNFKIATSAGLLTGVMMFGTLAYLPTYLQMVTGYSATIAGLLMVPMMGGMLTTSITAGQYVSRTGRYKKLPIIGSVLVGVALFLLSTLTITTPVWLICVYIALLGVGLGMQMQLLVLIVQNSFPVEVVGTATASNNYFRQIGATLGTAIVGSLFATRLTPMLADAIPDAAVNIDPHSLTPGLVRNLDEALRLPIIESYNDALTPTFGYMVPLAIVAAIILSFMEEKPLATEIKRSRPGTDVTTGELPLTEITRCAPGDQDETVTAGSPGAAPAESLREPRMR